MALIPPKVRAEILSRIQSDADEIGWAHLTQQEKSNKLAEWVQAEEIGQRLVTLLGGEMNVRLWLKDVALKMYSRSKLPTAGFVVERVFGDGCEVRAGSEGIKPQHCVVITSDGPSYICWGPHSNVSNLVWAALNASLDLSINAVHVAIVNKGLSLTPRDKKARTERIAAKCGVQLHWIEA